MEEKKAEEKIDTKKYSIEEKLALIQQEINVPKSRWNSFGEYHFRSCEDILTAIKPYLKKYHTLLKVSDRVEQIGNYIYITATARFIDLDTDKEITNEASARESDVKKGMDSSQLTGTASSYARKYALNGLLLLDDVKDADTDEFQKQQQKEVPKNNGGKEKPISEGQITLIKDLYEEDINKLNQQLSALGKKTIYELNIKEASDIIAKKTLKK